MALDLHRQLDILSGKDLVTPIKLIGCGGIGSPVGLALAKMGCQDIEVFDDDVIEPHNLSNQMYRKSDLGLKKVEALAKIIDDFADLKIQKNPVRINGQSLAGIVISGVDSMETRKEIWDKSLKYKLSVRLYIDARMAAEVSRIYTVNPCDPDDVEFYEKNLYSGEEAEQAPCTARAIIYNTLSIAGLVANQVKKFSRNEKLDKEIIFDLKNLILIKRG